MTLLLIMPGRETGALEAEIRRLAPGMPLRVWPDTGEPAEVDAVVTWNHPPGSLARFPRLRLIHSFGAGVDHILSDERLPAGVPVCRVVDSGLAEQMQAYLHCVLLEHRFSMRRYRRQQADRVWLPHPQNRGDRVGLLGLGQLGEPVGRYLAGVGYRVAGWSRTPKSLPGIECLSGPEGLDRLLCRADFVICLLPLTPATRGILDASLFARMKPGAHLVNVGRGGHLREPDLVDALVGGRLAGATLDVLSEEPPAAASTLWTAPNLTLTPHVASISDPAVVARQVVENMGRLQRGEPLLNPVDPARHY